MNFSISCAKLSYGYGGGDWVFADEVRTDDKEVFRDRGSLFVLVCVKPVIDLEESAVVKKIVDSLNVEYFGNLGLSAFNSLKESVQKVYREFSSKDYLITIASAAIHDGVVYSAVAGESEVILYREGAFAKIIQGKKEEVVTASGYPKKNDILVLSTSNLSELLGSPDIHLAFKEKDVNYISGIVLKKIESTFLLGGVGGLFILFEPKSFNPFLKLKGFITKKEKADLKISAKMQGFTFTRSLISRVFPERKIIVRKYQDTIEIKKGRKLAVSVGVLLLIILSVSIFFGAKQKFFKERRSKYEDRLSQARHNYDEALSIYNLNPQRSRELFEESKEIANSLVQEKVEDGELEDLISKIKESEGEILGEYRIEPDLFIDLTLLTDGFKGDSLSFSDGRIFVLDRTGQRVISVASETKRTEVVAGPDDIFEVKTLASYTDRVYVVSKNGVYEINLKGGNSRKGALVIESDWEGEVLVYAYAGNFYVLEKGKSTIYRYPGIEGKFSAKSTWLAPGIQADFSRIVSWTIDGSIWLLSETGSVFKYTMGSPQGFSIVGVDPQILASKSIFTTDDQEYLYLLDTGNSRVVVLTKSGEYKAQYFSDKFGGAKGLVASEKDGKIIVLAEDKLYSVPIKHKK